MCLSMSFYEKRQQQKAVKRAQKASRAAATNARAAAEAERLANEANQAAEQQAPDTGDMTEISKAKRQRGVGGTYLNEALGA